MRTTIATAIAQSRSSRVITVRRGRPLAVAVAIAVAVAVSACFESDREAALHGTVRGVHGGFS